MSSSSLPRNVSVRQIYAEKIEARSGSITASSIAADDVVFGFETITALPATLSVSKRVSVVDLSVPLGRSTAALFSLDASEKIVLPVSASDGALKTIVLAKDQTDHITVEAQTSLESDNSSFFVLDPDHRVLDLKFVGDRWTIDGLEKPEYYAEITNAVASPLYTYVNNPAIDASGRRVVFVTKGTNPTTIAILHHFKDGVEVQALDIAPLFGSSMNSIEDVVMSEDGSVVAIANSLPPDRKILVFRLSGDTYAVDAPATMVPTTNDISFGVRLGLNAAGTLVCSSSRSQFEIFSFGVGTSASVYTDAVANGRGKICALSGDGHWACSSSANLQLRIHSDVSGTWTSVQNIVISDYPDVYHQLLFDNNGTTLLYASTTTSAVSVYYRKPGTTTFSLLQSIPDIIRLNALSMTSDGLRLFTLNQTGTFLYSRASIQEEFTRISSSLTPTSTTTYGLGISPNGNALALGNSPTPGSFYMRFYKTPGSLIESRENTNQLDSSKTNSLAIIKSNATVGGDLEVLGDITLSSVPAFNDDAAAGGGGLTAGMLYQTTGSGAAPLNAAGILMIKQ